MEEKKESWIETLIELFKDYVENYWNDTKDPTIDNAVIYDWEWFYFGARFYSDEKVLSKKFWFIEWLVKNDKIDFEWKLNTIRFESLVDQTLDSYLALLMILSISSSPIEDLLLYLK